MNRELRELVWNRAGGCCEYCRMPQSLDPLPFEVDHVIATQHHGETTADNLCVACFACNRRKGPNLAGRDELTGALIPLFHPRRDEWETHFEWQGPTLLPHSRTPALPHYRTTATNGQTIGMTNMATIHNSTFSGTPTFTKSLKR